MWFKTQKATSAHAKRRVCAGFPGVKEPGMLDIVITQLLSCES